MICRQHAMKELSYKVWLESADSWVDTWSTGGGLRGLAAVFEVVGGSEAAATSERLGIDWICSGV